MIDEVLPFFVGSIRLLYVFIPIFTKNSYYRIGAYQDGRVKFFVDNGRGQIFCGEDSARKDLALPYFL